jgi:predicted dinucleotide-binding enzyme
MKIFSKIVSMTVILMASLTFYVPGASAADPALNGGKTVKIGVIGAGWLGGTVGKLLVKSGYEVYFSSRHPNELASLPNELGAKAHIGTPKEAAAFGQVILIATPYGALPEISRDFAQQLAGKVILDATNPSAFSLDSLSQEAEKNGVAQTTAKLFPHSTVVRAFSAVDASAIESSYNSNTDKLAVPLASDSPEALQLAAKLVQDTGCEPVIVGGLATARSFQRGGAGFRANTNASKLRALLGLNAQ